MRGIGRIRPSQRAVDRRVLAVADAAAHRRRDVAVEQLPPLEGAQQADQRAGAEIAVGEVAVGHDRDLRAVVEVAGLADGDLEALRMAAGEAGRAHRHRGIGQHLDLGVAAEALRKPVQQRLTLLGQVVHPASVVAVLCRRETNQVGHLRQRPQLGLEIVADGLAEQQDGDAQLGVVAATPLLVIRRRDVGADAVEVGLSRRALAATGARGPDRVQRLVVAGVEGI